MSIVLNGTTGITTPDVDTTDLTTTDLTLTNPPVIGTAFDTVETGPSSLSTGNNSYTTVDTIAAPAAGFWLFNISSATNPAINVNHALRLSHGAQSFTAGSGYADDASACNRTFLIELDGVNDVLIEAARSDDGGTASIKNIRSFGIRLG